MSVYSIKGDSMTTRKEQKEKKAEEIALAALELFVKKGYASTKTSEISKAASISEGLLFHYYGSKEKLLEALIDIAMQQNDQWIHIEQIDPVSYLKGIAEAILHCLKEEEINAKFFMLIAQLKQNEGIPAHIYEKIVQQEQAAEQMVEIIKKGQREGSIRQGNPYALLYLFSNTLQSIAVQHAIHRDTPFPEPQWILDMLLQHEGEEPV